MTYYMYRGCITDSMDNWLMFVGFNQFNLMLDAGELIELRTSHAHNE